MKPYSHNDSRLWERDDLRKVVDDGQAGAATNHNHDRYQPVATI